MNETLNLVEAGNENVAPDVRWLCNQVLGEIWIEHCPTGIMIADCFTKPPQGTTFRELRDMMMGNTDIALPTPNIEKATPAQPSVRIPDAPAHPESRSVLKTETALTVLPACGTHGRNRPTVSTEVKAGELAEGERTLSWAEAASR